jgi:hypothetical protein
VCKGWATLRFYAEEFEALGGVKLLLGAFKVLGQQEYWESIGISGAGDGNRTNTNGQNKGVTARFSVQLESNGVGRDGIE